MKVTYSYLNLGGQGSSVWQGGCKTVKDSIGKLCYLDETSVSAHNQRDRFDSYTFHAWC